MRMLLVGWVLTGIFAGVFARALFAEMVAQEQAVAIELQSKRDWLVTLESDRNQAIELHGPFHRNVAQLTKMIKATKWKIRSLEAEIEAE